MKDTSPLLTFRVFRAYSVTHQTRICIRFRFCSDFIALIPGIELGMYYGTKHLGCFMIRLEEVVLKPKTLAIISQINPSSSNRESIVNHLSFIIEPLRQVFWGTVVILVLKRLDIWILTKILRCVGFR